MSKEDFVNLSQAQKLRELGFDWNVSAYYDRGHFKHFGAEIVDYIYATTVNTDSLCGSCNSLFISDELSAEMYKDCYDAPTLSQACKWLRSKGWAVQVYLNGVRNAYFERVWKIEINSDVVDVEGQFDTYEQAQSAGIDVALGLLEKGDKQ